MKKTLINIWNWFNNKKTVIGSIGLLSLKLHFVKENMSPDMYGDLDLIFSALTGLGVGHKMTKSDVAKRVMKNIQASTKAK